MIYTSYFAKIKELERNDIIPIAICAKVPDWYRGLHVKWFAPKYKSFMEWKKNHDNDFFTEHYYGEVLNGLDVYGALKELYTMASIPVGEELYTSATIPPDKDIALICYEKPSDFCHRHLVADWLNENGFKCKEWGVD